MRMTTKKEGETTVEEYIYALDDPKEKLAILIDILAERSLLSASDVSRIAGKHDWVRLLK